MVCNCWLVQDAAKQLNVGVTTLKKICRIAKVTRWPFRKRTSIERLIERTKYFMEEDDEQPGKGQKIAALQTLQEEKADLKVSAMLANTRIAHLPRSRQSGRITTACLLARRVT